MQGRVAGHQKGEFVFVYRPSGCGRNDFCAALRVWKRRRFDISVNGMT
jgi:hypothetical protein